MSTDPKTEAAIAALADKLLSDHPDINPATPTPLAKHMLDNDIMTPEAQKAFIERHRKANPEHYGRVSTGGNYARPERNPPPPPPKPVEYGTPAMELYWTGKITPNPVNIGSGVVPKITPALMLEAANNPDSAIAAALRAARKRKGGA